MKLYICQTLDGYIARPDGSIDFLDQFNEEIPKSPNELIANSYANFMKDITNVVEGYTTFNQLKAIGYVDHYAKFNHYVITNAHKDETNQHVTSFIDFDKLESLNLDDNATFLVGGSHVITEALNRKLVTSIIITQLPIFIGSGIKLFDNITVNPHIEIAELFNDNRFYQVEYKVTY